MGEAVVKKTADGQLEMWCIGCDRMHIIPAIEKHQATEVSVQWLWDGSIDYPTISPSILVLRSLVQPRCHSFIRMGRWEYLSDCDHEYRGQLIVMLPVSLWPTEKEHI